MTVHRDQRGGLELTDLSPQVRAAIESVMDAGELRVCRSGETVGRLLFQPEALEGVVVPAAADDTHEPPPQREDVTVVATTMRMSGTARTRLSDAFGPAYVVLDVADAPPTTDILLTHAVSPQLTQQLAAMFPQARILVTEILDEELGMDVRGPVGRLLDAGAHAYLPPRPLEQLAENVHSYLAAQGRAELRSGDAAVLELGHRSEAASTATDPPG